MKKFLPRKPLILGVLKADTKLQLMTRIDAFTEFLYHDYAVQLIYNDKSDRYYLVEYLNKNQDLKKKGQFVPLRLPFIANDPFGHAVTADDNDEIGITTDGYTWTETNGGQTFAYPVITVTFNQNQEHIYISNNSITGCRFDISKSVVNTDVIVIDSETLNITLNGLYSPGGFGNGGTGKMEYILLEKGANTLEIGTDDATLDVDINVNYRKIYLS